MFSSNIADEEIKKRIAEFRGRAEAGIPDAECINQITSIFGDVFTFPVQMSKYQMGTKFFRARAIGNDDTNIPLRTVRSVGDAWEPPAARVTVQGRLSKAGQSVLYCCADDPDLAIEEARARENNHVAVICYRAIRPVSVAVLGNYSNSTLPKDEASNLFYSFLEEEFGRFVQKGHEARYSITRAIADTFFTYPEQDAWCYRSVQSPDKFNAAFLSDKSQESLELVGVMICDLRASHPNQLSVKMVVSFDSKAGKAEYNLIGSQKQRELFPEIT